MNLYVKKAYFECKIDDQDKVQDPKCCYNSFSRALTDWLKGLQKSMSFAFSNYMAQILELLE